MVRWLGMRTKRQQNANGTVYIDRDKIITDG